MFWPLWFFQRKNLAQTARHCCILALIAAVPTAALGIMDWQHFYGGSLLFPIQMKLILAGTLIILLIITVTFGFFSQQVSKVVIVLYTLALGSTIGLGYFGGELVYSRASGTGVLERPAAAGEGSLVFNQNCSACHLSDSTATRVGPRLKGLFKNDKFSVSGWTVSEENMRKRLNEPIDKMPPFKHLKEEELRAIVDFLKTQ